MRIGQGYDVHRLVEGRDLILGGVTVPYEKGLLGHSDADVLVHAVMDALLGAAALGDIGQHFPDTDPAYKGISSIKLLEAVGKLLEEKGYVIENIDATIIAQRPKLAAYRPPDGREYRPCVKASGEPCQCESHHGRGAWIYGNRRGNFFSGNYLIDIGRGLLL